MNTLIQLHADIWRRVQSIRAETPDWLCGKGCASCCRHLADMPKLTAAEWDLLQQGLAGLPDEKLAAIGRDLAAWTQGRMGTEGTEGKRGLVCPMLDPLSNACPVYLQRPVACRTYGFYVQREKGLFCGDIQAHVSAGKLADVVWGNHDAVDQQLAALGEARALSDWFADWQSQRVAAQPPERD